jgi:stage V sporulation protein S
MADKLVDTEEEVLRVGATTPPKELAAAIAHSHYTGNPRPIRAIGAASVNQAVKALVIANQYMASRGKNLVFRPGFQTVTMPDGAEVSAIVFRTTEVS